MKRFFLISALTLALGGTAPMLIAQTSKSSDEKKSPSASSVQPQRWFRCDLNKDGICDYCGRPVGSGLGWSAAGVRAGQTATRQGRGAGRGMGWNCPWRQSAPPQNSQPPQQ